VLRTLLPQLARETEETRTPVRLLVIDSLSEVFQSEDRATTNTLVRRSQQIAETSVLLHALAAAYHVAILVVNDITDTFSDDHPSTLGGDLSYRTSSQWFSGPVPYEGMASTAASLGLAWANQPNTRLFISRTPWHQTESHPIWQLSALFNHLQTAQSSFFIILTAGITSVSSDVHGSWDSTDNVMRTVKSTVYIPSASGKEEDMIL
jgi:hypothetical protein